MCTINIRNLLDFLNENFEVEYYSKEIVKSEEFAALYKEDLCDNYKSELVYVAKILTNEKYLYGSQDGSRLLFVYSVDGINLSNYHIIGGESILMQVLNSNGNFENIELKPINANADDFLLKDFVLSGSELVAYTGNERIVHIPMRITKIGDEAFANSNVEVINMTNEVVAIGNKAFNNCHKLKKIELSNVLESIGEYAFANCYNLKNVFLSNTITSVGKGTFCECYKLTKIEIPSKVGIIPEYFCFTCSSLSRINFHEKVYEIHESSFTNCVNVKKLVLPRRLMTIGKTAFLGIKIKELIIPDTVKVIENRCFADCYKLSRVIINNKTEIKNNAFLNSEKATFVFVD